VREFEQVGAQEPIDPDVVPTLERSELQALLAVSAGAIVGSIGRFMIERAWPATAGEIPWSTFVINLTGSFALPFVVVAAAHVWPRAWLLRPALGTGVLGGYTTFSTFAVEQQQLFSRGAVLVGSAYVAMTLVSCALGTRIALSCARWTFGRWAA
jgi:CrcB protein